MKQMEDSRPDPDHLLREINKDEVKKTMGKLKIFLGMSAGVGKTYAMLRTAKILLDKGIDVVAGIIETHNRKETEAQLIGFEVLPKKQISYKGKILEEFDIDLALKRRAQIILVDELAHSNVPESRNNKRYLDIVELLHAGLDVYTTLNVQHIESINDAVKEITDVSVHETVPDSFLDLADEIIVIDLSPEDLIKRLQEGLIYGSERVETAQSNFFKIGNLTALRELTLRAAAARVDKELREYRQSHNIQEIWKSSHHLMVAVFASPYAEYLIRSTRRIADALDAPWIGAYVEDNKHTSEEEKLLMARNIALVQELGGEIITSKDDDTVNGLLRIARQNNVTQIVVGKSARKWWKNLFTGGSLVTRLMALSGDIDIYSIASSKVIGKRKRFFSGGSFNVDQIGSESGVLFITVILSWFLAGALDQFLGHIAIGFVFLLVVCVSGLYLSRLSVYILAILFAFIHNFFFIPPLYSISINSSEDFMILLMFFTSASVIGHLTSRLKAREKSLATREEILLVSYHLAKELLKSKSVDTIAEIGASYLEKIFEYEVRIVVSCDGAQAQAGSWFYCCEDSREKAVIEWVLANGKHAGRFTETLSSSKGHYIPLIGKAKTIGVICIDATELKNLDGDQFSALENISTQIASALEREIFHIQAKKLEVVENSQKLYKTLLDSVSHELKTPLSAIKGCGSALLDPLINQNSNLTSELANEIIVGSARLQRIVENLLDMSRIDSGLIKPKIIASSAVDLIQSAIRKFQAEVNKRKINFISSRFERGVLCDPILTEQALINILQNAHMYSPEDKPIDITIKEEQNFLKITIRDFGPGIRTENNLKIFEKFYRANPKRTGGIGLGLSIVKNFLEIQNGSVGFQNAKDGGAEFSISLPLERLA